MPSLTVTLILPSGQYTYVNEHFCQGSIDGMSFILPPLKGIHPKTECVIGFRPENPGSIRAHKMDCSFVVFFCLHFYFLYRLKKELALQCEIRSHQR